MLSTKEGFVEILEFTHFARIFKFNRTPKIVCKEKVKQKFVNFENFIQVE